MAAFREITVTSWQSLLAELHSSAVVPRSSSAGGHFRSPFVFRGVDNAQWKLQSSLERLPKARSTQRALIEGSLIRSFRKYANAGLFDEKSEWYVLAVAQHNGLPTRCLDWSSAPLIAAHFACGDEKQKSSDGVIWCLNAEVLRDLTDLKIRRTGSRGLQAGRSWVYDTRYLEESFGTLEGLKQSTQKTNMMLLWEPPSLDSRIASQSGLLTVMNSANVSQHSFFDHHAKLFPDLMLRIVIAASAKAEIRDMLDQNGISERSIFPDLPGLCSWLRRYYSKAW